MHAALACAHDPGALRLPRVLRRLPPPRRAGQGGRHHRPPLGRAGRDRPRAPAGPRPSTRRSASRSRRWASGSTCWPRRRRPSAACSATRRRRSTGAHVTLTDARNEPRPGPARPAHLDRRRRRAAHRGASSPARRRLEPAVRAARGAGRQAGGARRPLRRRRAATPARSASASTSSCATTRPRWRPSSGPGPRPCGRAPSSAPASTTLADGARAATLRPAPTRSTWPCGRRGTRARWSGRPPRWPPCADRRSPVRRHRRHAPHPDSPAHVRRPHRRAHRRHRGRGRVSRQQRPNRPGGAACPFCVGGPRGARALRRQGVPQPLAVVPRRPVRGRALHPRARPHVPRPGLARAPAGSSTCGPTAPRRSGPGDDVAYVLVFENRGEEVGATIAHPHGQIYAYDHVPDAPLAELRRADGGATAALCAPARRRRWTVAEATGWRAWVPAGQRLPVRPAAGARRPPARPAVARRAPARRPRRPAGRRARPARPPVRRPAALHAVDPPAARPTAAPGPRPTCTPHVVSPMRSPGRAALRGRRRAGQRRVRQPGRPRGRRGRTARSVTWDCAPGRPVGST